MPARSKPYPINYHVVSLPTSNATSQEPQKAPRAPSDLPTAAAKIWRRTVRDMIEAGTWNPVFERTLATYCVLEAQFVADFEGFTAAKLTQKRLLANDLGLSPSTFGKVQHQGGGKRRRNEFDDL